MKRKLEELNLLDDFLFGTLISHPVYGEQFARILIKVILNRDVKILKIVPQMNYYGQDTDRHGARLDVYIEEADGVVQGDVRLGSIYNRLKNIIIIMLLPYDPFGYDRMVYTVRNKCLEEPEMEYDDGALNLFLYTRGKTGVISQELKELLQYFENTSWNNAVNKPLREVQSMVDKVKYDKEVSISYMKSYERDQMIRNEGLAAGRTDAITKLAKTIQDFLSDLGTIPEDIVTKINSETDLDILTCWMKLAAKSASIEEFAQKLS